MQVYNQGVYIRQYSSSMFGLNSVANFKAQQDVEFAHNDVMDSCPRWQAAQKALHKFGSQEVTAKTRLRRDRHRPWLVAGFVRRRLDALCRPAVTSRQIAFLGLS